MAPQTSRRQFLAGSAALGLFPGAALASTCKAGLSGETIMQGGAYGCNVGGWKEKLPYVISEARKALPKGTSFEILLSLPYDRGTYQSVAWLSESRFQTFEDIDYLRDFGGPLWQPARGVWLLQRMRA